MRRARTVLEEQQLDTGSYGRAPIELVTQFQSALNQGDQSALLKLLGAEAILIADGGGKVRSALNPIYGADRIARFFLGVRRKTSGKYAITPVTINSEPGLCVSFQGRFAGVISFAGTSDRITRIYFVSNPDKLHSKP